MQCRAKCMAEGEFYTFWFEKNLQGDIVAVYNDSGVKTLSYSYDAWGNAAVTRHNATGKNSYSTYNPFRYRGYYYDVETGFYYLQSRYYDPHTGRFINADGFVSTGQGLNGYNMFAYCGNNPVSRVDANGRFWLTALIVTAIVVCSATLTGCSSQSASQTPRSNLANAPDLDINTASNGSYNCYGNAIGKQIVTNPTGYKKGDSVEDTFAAVQKDLGGKRNCIRLDSIDSPIEDGWYKVAMMCGATDYHFIRLTENGWFNKSGSDPLVGGCYIPENFVTAKTWRAIGTINGEAFIFNRPIDPIYYNESGPLYFAVRIGWDE